MIKNDAANSLLYPTPRQSVTAWCPFRSLFFSRRQVSHPTGSNTIVPRQIIAHRFGQLTRGGYDTPPTFVYFV